MARTLRIIVGTALTITFGSAVWLTVTPRIETATPSEVLALVPRHLREVPLSDPIAEARFMSVYRLMREGWAKNESRLRVLIEAGNWQVPAHFIGQNVEWPFDGLSEVLAEKIAQSAQKGDHHKCSETVRLALGFVHAYDHAGGELLDAEVATNMLPPLADAIEAAVQKRSLTGADRMRLLILVPKDNGAETVADAVETNFRVCSLPRLLRAARGPKSLEALLSECSLPADPGTFDPLDTTRLFVRFAETDLRACQLGVDALTRDEKRLPHDVLERLPTKPFPPTVAWDCFRYRWSSNHGSNTLGRWWAVTDGFTGGFDLVTQRSEAWQRIRTALEKRSIAIPGSRLPKRKRNLRGLPEYLD